MAEAAANEAPLNSKGNFVLYWMNASRRTRWNFALERAVEIATDLGKPLLVVETLESGSCWASDRHHAFVLGGMADNKAVLIARGVGRFARPIRYPAVVKMADSQLADGRLSTTSEPLVAVVVMALEEDGGRDIRRAYGILQSHGELHLIESCDQPNASDIGELLLRPAEWKQPKKVTLAVDGQSFDAECRSDKWIAASAFSAPLRTTHRVHLVSDDKTNDWTAVLTLRRR